MAKKLKFYDGDTFEHGGRSFTVTLPYDEFGRLPWEDDDGAGIVTEWTTRDKAPGERLLCSDRSSKRFYDWAETMKKAKKDGWGLAEDDKAKLAEKLGRAPTKGEIVAEAVARDFERMRSFCNDQWSYVGVVVTEDESGEEDSLWGVESDCADYVAELVQEMAEGITKRLDASVVASIQESRPDLAPDV